MAKNQPVIERKPGHKAKSLLCSSKYYAMKMYRGGEWSYSSTHWPLYLRGKYLTILTTQEVGWVPEPVWTR